MWNPFRRKTDPQKYYAMPSVKMADEDSTPTALVDALMDELDPLPTMQQLRRQVTVHDYMAHDPEPDRE